MAATVRSTRRRIVIVTIVTALLALVAPGVRAEAATVPEPHEDPFYVPPAGFEATAPGTVLRSRNVSTRGLGLPVPVRTTQALVRSTDAHGRPMAIVTSLLVPKVIPALRGPRPLLSYQPAIDSLGDQCQPSHTLQTGTEKEIVTFLPALLQGWAVVVTDYQGPKHAYGAGRLEGQATLDGIRGALALPATGLKGLDTKVVMWGYSGGALATGWAAQLESTYAPELNLLGAAAGGTPGDLNAAGRQIDGSLVSGLFLAAAIGVSREYPELLTLFSQRGAALVDEFNDLCVAEESSRHPFEKLESFATVRDPLSHPIAQAVLEANKMGGSAPTIPMYLYHSVFDQLIPYSSAVQLNADWCARGGRVQLVTDLASEHISYAVTGAPGALLYLMDRVEGRAAPSTCPR